MSLVKGCENVGLGNIIGANIPNLLLVIGIPATITGMKLETQTVRVDAPLGALLMGILILPHPFPEKKEAVSRGRAFRLLCPLLCVQLFLRLVLVIGK